MKDVGVMQDEEVEFEEIEASPLTRMFVGFVYSMIKGKSLTCTSTNCGLIRPQTLLSECSIK